MSKLAIITTHPIQYNAPLFKKLAERGLITIKVFYTWGESVLQYKFDPGFGKKIEWDIPLLEGYDYCFVENVASMPGSSHFKGIDNPTIIKEIENWNPDAILVFGWAFKSHLKVLRYFSGKKKILFRGDSTLLNESAGFSIKKILRQLFLKWVYRHIDNALYVGQANRAYFKKMGMLDRQLLEAPHAIDNQRFETEQAEAVKQFRSNLGISETDLLILFAGKFEPQKNPQMLLNAFAHARLSRSVYCLFVGNGSEEKRLKQMAKDLEIKNALFLDFQNQSRMPIVYQAADIYCLPSVSETWGLAINEAMAAGCAILVSDRCGGASDLVENGANGYIFKSGEEQSLVGLLELMTNDKNQLKLMGEHAHKRIQHWNYDRIAQVIENLLNN